MLLCNHPITKGIGVILILTLLTSCIRYEELVNFNTGPQFSEEPAMVAPPPEFVVQPDDILQIIVTSSNIIRTGPGPLEYLVDKDGRIQLPILGDVKVSGMSTAQVTDSLTQMLQPYVKDAVVKLRIINFRVTVSGEVNRPGPVTVPEESVTLMEALSMSGDLTDFANRESILVIREVAGERSFQRLNLHSREVFMSDYYYLQQGDIVYVEPLPEKAGILSNQARGTFSVIGGVSSVISLLLTILVTTGAI
jgi:polysaccharide export outer membrane protein